MEVHIIGSGINSLVAGAVLAKAGHGVQVHERNDWLGGNMQTVSFGEAGFLHERFSGFHPLFTTSPGYQELKADLARHGLEYLNTSEVTGVLLPDGRSGILHDTREANVAALNAIWPGDGDAYALEMARFDEHAQMVFGLLGSELWGWAGTKLAAGAVWEMGPEGLLEFLGEALPNARKWLDNTFESEVSKALCTPWTLHTGLGPDDQASSLMLRVILASFEKTGMPVPKGGGSNLANALVAIIEENGSTCTTGEEVSGIEVAGDSVKGLIVNGESLQASCVLANVSPTALYQKLLPASAVPEKVQRDAAAYRYGRGNMQIHLSLSAKPAWPDEALLNVAMVHVTPGLNGVSRAVNEAIRGLLPAEPTIVVGQHTALDPSRAPAGDWTFWLQLQELPAHPQGDAAGKIDCGGYWTREITDAYADRVVDRLCAQIPNLRDSILERNVISPAELGQINVNLVGGDPYCGSAALDQFLFWRPLPALRGHETTVKNLYHIGAATHPGPGLNGTSGYLVAKGLG